MLKINQELCTKCGACEAECPVIESEELGFHKCIVYAEGRYTINCDECKECGNCVKICPVKAVEEMD